jgi:hypothetical protein
MTAASNHEKLELAAGRGADDVRPWRRWLVAFLATTAVVGIAVYLAIVLIDPFATGRFTPVGRIDLASGNPRLDKAGLVRDLRFDAAIFGSSTA